MRLGHKSMGGRVYGDYVIFVGAIHGDGSAHLLLISSGGVG